MRIVNISSENALLKQQVLDLDHKLNILLSSVLVKDSHNSSLPPSLSQNATKVFIPNVKAKGSTLNNLKSSVVNKPHSN